VAKVSSQIQREISEMFIYDKVTAAAAAAVTRLTAMEKNPHLQQQQQLG
jgi:hypothetical protein